MRLVEKIRQILTKRRIDLNTQQHRAGYNFMAGGLLRDGLSPQAAANEIFTAENLPTKNDFFVRGMKDAVEDFNDLKPSISIESWNDLENHLDAFWAYNTTLVFTLTSKTKYNDRYCVSVIVEPKNSFPNWITYGTGKTKKEALTNLLHSIKTTIFQETPHENT